MTLKELLKDVELPVKVRRKDWKQGSCFEARYINKNRFYGHDETGVPISEHCSSEHYSLYFEPKKLVKVYKYDYQEYSGRWTRGDDYFKDDEDFMASWKGVNNFKRRDDDFIEVPA